MKDPRQRLRWLCLALMAAMGGLVVTPLTAPQDAAPPRARVVPPAAPRPPRDYTLLFVGDVMLSRAVGEGMAARKDWSLPFRLVEEAMRDADLRYCNLECPVSDRGRNLHHLYSFRADPRALEGLEAAGFNVASQANNHAYDWGPQALLDSLDRLRAAGIHPVGAGQNMLEAHYPVLVRLGDLRIAFLAYVNIDPAEATAGADRPGVAWLDLPQVLTDIRFARPLADLVIVCPHWGVEYAVKPTREQVDEAHQMIDAGADMIVGSHPHVVQPVEHYNGHWIAYSLGNFIFDQREPRTHRGLMLRTIVRNKHIREVDSIPISINSEFQASIAPASAPSPKPLVAEQKPVSSAAP
jgi:poly-gamma-glutamate capsule biosynthesis protein CapA/YwtB (metallophosphatase superfamily)